MTEPHLNGTHSTVRLLMAVAGSAIGSLIIALTVFYVGYGQNVVTKDALQAAINTYSPYAQDRGLIRTELNQLSSDLAQLAMSESENSRQTAADHSLLVALQADVDRLLSLHTRR